jgi:hypothetical protein
MLKKPSALVAAAAAYAMIPNAVQAQQNVNVAAHMTDDEMQRECAVYAVNAPGETAQIAPHPTTPGKNVAIFEDDYKNGVVSTITLTFTDTVNRTANGAYELGDLSIQYKYNGDPVLTFHNGAFEDDGTPGLNFDALKSQTSKTAQKIWSIQRDCLTAAMDARTAARAKLGSPNSTYLYNKR